MNLMCCFLLQIKVVLFAALDPFCLCSPGAIDHAKSILSLQRGFSSVCGNKSRLVKALIWENDL